MNKTVINSNQAPAPIGPYSQAILSGNTLYCSGQVAINPENGELNNADVKTETSQVMQNLKAILIEAGLGFSQVVKCTIFLKDINDFTVVNQVYGQFFKDAPPARETIQVAKLPLDVKVEISLIAVK